MTTPFKMPEPVAWAMVEADGKVYDCICTEEHDNHQGAYTLPLYTAQALRNVLEQAARKCEDVLAYVEDDPAETFAAHIRAMIKEIK